MRRCLLTTERRNRHAQTGLMAFVQGLEKHGWRVDKGGPFAEHDMVLQWGIEKRPSFLEGQEAGAVLCVMEQGYLGDRTSVWRSVSFGGLLNGRATFYAPLAVLDDGLVRFRMTGSKLLPYDDAPKDGYVLIMGQVPTDYSLRGIDIYQWMTDTVGHYKAQGERVMVRHHPKVVSPRVALADQLAGAKLVVTFNSNSGVDAVLAGRPVVVCDDGGMAKRVASRSLEEKPVTPSAEERYSWASWLSWCQWRDDEMASGVCWEMVCPPALKA